MLYIAFHLWRRMHKFVDAFNSNTLEPWCICGTVVTVADFNWRHTNYLRCVSIRFIMVFNIRCISLTMNHGDSMLLNKHNATDRYQAWPIHVDFINMTLQWLPWVIIVPYIYWFMLCMVAHQYLHCKKQKLTFQYIKIRCCKYYTILQSFFIVL